jgi:hypothetical protein
MENNRINPIMVGMGGILLGGIIGAGVAMTLSSKSKDKCPKCPDKPCPKCPDVPYMKRWT